METPKSAATRGGGVRRYKSHNLHSIVTPEKDEESSSQEQQQSSLRQEHSYVNDNDLLLAPSSSSDRRRPQDHNRHPRRRHSGTLSTADMLLSFQDTYADDDNTKANISARTPRTNKTTTTATTTLLKKRRQRSSRDSNNQNSSRSSSALFRHAKNVPLGLTVAGVSQALLTTLFRLFHVQVFLQSYQLGLEEYSSGSLVVSIITTISSVVGAYLVDQSANHVVGNGKSRMDSVGRAGWYFVLAFLTPFFYPMSTTSTTRIFHNNNNNESSSSSSSFFSFSWLQLHFILSTSLYQTMYSYMAILLGSIVTDSHAMSNQTRAQFMASGKAVNLVLGVVVSRLGLWAFYSHNNNDNNSDNNTESDTSNEADNNLNNNQNHHNLHDFRLFLLVLAAISLFLFQLSQSMISGSGLWQRVQRCFVNLRLRSGFLSDCISFLQQRLRQITIAWPTNAKLLLFPPLSFWSSSSTTPSRKRRSKWIRSRSALSLCSKQQRQVLHESDKDGDDHDDDEDGGNTATNDDDSSLDKSHGSDKKIHPRVHHKDKTNKNNSNAMNLGEDQDFSSSSARSDRPRKFVWRKVAADFAGHYNFRVWVVIEMLLHMQITFNGSFLKTFVDQLVAPELGRETSDWLLSVVWPLSQLVTICAYIPIQKWGYSRVYLILFVSNFVASNLLYWCVESSEPSSHGVLIFLIYYAVSTRAVQSAGFHLAMADMVLEMKQKHVKEGRFDEPSVAGLFMGANALLCKPVESILPMMAAYFMESDNVSSPLSSSSSASRESLFHLLVLPPMACSVLQMIAWTSFDLTPRRTAAMRRELQERNSHRNSFIDMLDP